MSRVRIAVWNHLLDCRWLATKATLPETHRTEALPRANGRREKEQKRMKRLHPAAKYKRVLSQCDYWFSVTNLISDPFLLAELALHGGWCRVSTLASFPRLKHWGTADVVSQAFEVPGAERYETRDGKVRPAKLFGGYKPSVLASATDWAEMASTGKLLKLNEWFSGTETSSLKNVLGGATEVDRTRIDKTDRSLLVASIQHQLGQCLEDCSLPMPNPFAYADIVDVVRAREQRRVPDAIHEDVAVERLPLFQHKAEVIVARTPQEVENAVAAVRGAGELGFDVEYATLDTDLRLLPAMLQLATDSRVALIWLDKLPEHGVQELRYDRPLGALLADATVTKVGNGARADATNLEAFAANNNLLLRSVIDLDSSNSGRNSASLSDLVRSWLSRHLQKRKVDPRTSMRQYKVASKNAHWRAPKLSDSMRRYAANDALASLLVWKAMKRHANCLKSTSAPSALTHHGSEMRRGSCVLK